MISYDFGKTIELRTYRWLLVLLKITQDEGNGLGSGD